MPITIPPEEEAVPKRPKNVEAIPASQWGQIASRLQAQGVGGPEVTRALDGGDGVKALARFVSRRLGTLSGEPKPAAARLLTPKKRGNHDVREKPQTPPRAYLGGFDITLDDLFIEIEALRVALKAIEIFRNAGGFTDKDSYKEYCRYSFDDCRRVAALLASVAWGRNDGRKNADLYESLLASRPPHQNSRVASAMSSLFKNAIFDLAHWPHAAALRTRKPLIAVLDQLREQLETVAGNKHGILPERDRKVTGLLVELFRNAPEFYFTPGLVFMVDWAKNFADCITRLRTQLEYIREQLVNANAYADKLLTAPPDPHTMAHKKVPLLELRVVEENLRMIEESLKMDIPQGVQEASKVHIHACQKTLVCTGEMEYSH